MTFSLLPFLLIFCVIKLTIASADCTVSNCAVHFYCHNCDQRKVCSPNSLIQDLVIRPSNCIVQQSGNLGELSQCQLGCIYCFSDTTSGTSVQTCTICSDGYELDNGECFALINDQVKILYESTSQRPLTTSYLSYEDSTPVSIQDKLAFQYVFSTTITVFVAILAVVILSLIAHYQFQAFIRFILFSQHLYHFSFKSFPLPNSQYVLCLLNFLNFNFLNNVVYFLPERYYEMTKSRSYFILNVDHNLLRNAGGSMLVFLVGAIVFVGLVVARRFKQGKIRDIYGQFFLTLWCLLQNNILYFSLCSLIKMNEINTNRITALALRITSGGFIILFFIGLFILYKFFENKIHSSRIQRNQLISLLSCHFLMNILLCFSDSSISEYFVVLIRLVYIVSVFYFKGQTDSSTHSSSLPLINVRRRRFAISEWFGLTIYVALFTDLDALILVGGLIFFLIICVWDITLTNHEISMLDELKSFNEGQNIAEPNPVLMTEGDLISYPTMKKLYSSASTDA